MTGTDTQTEKKVYALRRMTQAIGRAIRATYEQEKERAARWAAAWGLLAGVRVRRARLRASELSGLDPAERRRVPR